VAYYKKRQVATAASQSFWRFPTGRCRVEPISKKHQAPHFADRPGAERIDLPAFRAGCCAFKATGDLPLGEIGIFEAGSRDILRHY
jgi:hypothetical protein